MQSMLKTRKYVTFDCFAWTLINKSAENSPAAILVVPAAIVTTRPHQEVSDLSVVRLGSTLSVKLPSKSGLEGRQCKECLLRPPQCIKMDSDILNIEDIVMGRGLPDPPPEAPPEKPVEPYKPKALNGPPIPPVQSYQHENLQCFQCFITFCSAKAKERHMKKSHREEYKQQLQQGNTLFTCYVCDRTFLSSEELTQHQPTHSKDDKPFKCVHCKESFKTFSELTSHRRQVCPEKQMVCKDCNETFRSAGLLRAHRLSQHPRPDVEAGEQPEDTTTKTHRCKKCGQGFEAESDLLAHQEKYPEGQQCNGSTSSVKKRGRPSKVEEPAVAEKKGKRKKKDEAEASEEAAKASSASESAAVPAEEKGKAGVAKRGRPSKVAPKPETEDKKSPEDDSQGAKEAKEKKPKADPAPARQHPCPECDLAFSNLIQLRAHKKEKHTPRKAHPCEECEESFARPEQLDAHMSRAHAVGRFACPTCGKSFGRERTLTAHQKSHAEEKPENPSAKR
ncbi:zinc finger protein 576.2 isoform X1 [Mugil cephalus]|uniref:zinc finger protein 576.2 isoform X1 n=2 Tax=Mugil cephalus TaxID=48193 RepID=UPI001FB6BEDA|nr:zinc finger protein 576.2 isoform X1 [Mugil cephalus]